MDLRPFTEAHAATVAGWPTSAREVEMWCARTDFPLSPRIVTGWRLDQDVRSHLLFDGPSDEGDPLGYGELWLDTEEDEVELARLIVAPGARGRGVGRELVRALTVLARDTGLADVFMRVHPDNDRALRCYRGAGFLPVDPALAATWNAPQPVDYVWLRHAEPA
ncbi:GNAT family N-acetyltransferase [Streptosporangium longisporum]|uniref:N-acetyltransferase domain-containing protein n=1 Tax=Streptosporangium longisporum TaxID=46187 RepID=A0ABN3XV48_9ACTN